MKAIILLAVLVLLPSLSAQKDITLSDEMPYPNIQLEKGSKIEATKLINESFVESFSEINFEISSRLYVHKGKLNETDVYNTSLYEPAAEAKCKIFPTDLKITSYSSMKVDSPDNDVVIIEKPQFEKSRNITAHVYLSAEKDENTFSIESYEVTADFSHLPATMPKSKQIK